MSTPVQTDPLVMPPVRGRPAGSRWMLALAAALAAVVSLMLPAPQSGVPVTLLVADLSQSMRAGAPPRYLLAAQAMESVAATQPGSIGLITCAAGARLASPPSTDHAALLDTLARLQVEAARPELAPGPGSLSGTRLAEGLRLAREMLARASGPCSVLVFSDGDDPAPDDTAAQEATRLAETGIRLQLIPVGTANRPEPIPMGPGAWLQWRNQRVQSTVNIPSLQAIAAAAGTSLTTRWQPVEPPSALSLHLQTVCLLASLILSVWFLTGSILPARPSPAIATVLLALSLPSCQGQPKPTASGEALLHQAAALPATDPSRAAIARQAETLLRQEPSNQATKLRLLEALLLVGESAPMDRQALLAAQELALESEPLLNDRLPLLLARIRLRLAQCKPTPITRPSPSGDSFAEESPTASGDPGSSSPIPQPVPKAKPGQGSHPPGDTTAEAALPGAGRLPVLLDDRQPQPLAPGEAGALLRAARLWRHNRESSRQPWERPALEVPDW